MVGAGGSYAVNSTGGESSHILTENEMPSHNHNQSYLTLFNQPASDGIDRWTYRSASANMTHVNMLSGIATENKGGSQAHNNMPPYLAVYMWQRTS